MLYLVVTFLMTVVNLVIGRLHPTFTFTRSQFSLTSCDQRRIDGILLLFGCCFAYDEAAGFLPLLGWLFPYDHQLAEFAGALCCFSTFLL